MNVAASVDYLHCTVANSPVRLCFFLFVMPDRRRWLVPGFDTLTRGDRYGGRTHPGAMRK